MIVFGGEAFDTSLIREIHEQMTYYTPQESMPHILHDSSGATGIEGLILSCRSYLTTYTKVVQNIGV